MELFSSKFKSFCFTSYLYKNLNNPFTFWVTSMNVAITITQLRIPLTNAIVVTLWINTAIAIVIICTTGLQINLKVLLPLRFILDHRNVPRYVKKLLRALNKSRIKLINMFHINWNILLMNPNTDFSMFWYISRHNHNNINYGVCQISA